jgi:uncharacterized membrane protein
MAALKQSGIANHAYDERQSLRRSVLRLRTEQPVNVGMSERVVSAAAGSILTLLGLKRGHFAGLLAAGVGGALVYRGLSGHCSVYQALDVDTHRTDDGSERLERSGVHVSESMLIDKSPEELYTFWRNFENLPQVMTHLASVTVTGDRQSHWVAKAPSILGGTAEWDAEITADEPNRRMEWRSLPGSAIDHRGSVVFVRAPGDRGTGVRVTLDYQPPAGQLGKWIAKLFGKAPEQQIWDGLRNLKRVMEAGETPTTEGQSRGLCLGRVARRADRP